MSPCTFCEIIAGRLEASFVHQDDAVVAFMDVSPANPGHVLVVPRAHASGLAHLPEEDGMRLWGATQRIAVAVRKSGLRCEAVRLSLADGAAAGQEVFHVHLHVVPHFEGDGFSISARWTTPDRARLDQDALAIRKALT